MSPEARGEEGNVAERWEDTAMRHEWDVVRERFDKWKLSFHKEFDPTHDRIVRILECAMDNLELVMGGRI